MKLNFKNKIKISSIIKIMIIFVVIFIPMSHVFGAINPDNLENAGSDYLKQIIAAIMSIAIGPLTAALATLVNGILIVVVTLLSAIFAPVESSILFPSPDDIIFNRLAFFDPNFINRPVYNTLSNNQGGFLSTMNAASNSIVLWVAGNNTGEIKKAPVYMLKDVLQNLYYTSFLIAGTIFVLAAMLIGIKLAISTIATEKAHYKEALMVWVKGIVLLFVAHFLILAIFTLNEQIVNVISKAASNIHFPINLFESIPLIGSTVGKAVSSILTGARNLIAGIFGADTSGWSDVGDIQVPGYFGLQLMFMTKALGGDLSASIVCGIMIGQTITLIFMYLKRLFISIFLAVIAPLIIAADVIKKSI